MGWACLCWRSGREGLVGNDIQLELGFVHVHTYVPDYWQMAPIDKWGQTPSPIHFLKSSSQEVAWHQSCE